MKKFFLFVALTLIIFSLASCGKKEREQEIAASEPVVGGMAPDFNLKDINGSAVSLSMNRGKVVLVEFWATWCPPCRELIPGFVSLYEKYKNKGFVLLALASEDEGADELKSFAKDYRMTYPVVLADRNAMIKYGVTCIPVSFLIDKDGKIASKHVGSMPGLLDELEAEIKKLL